ncbi:MAG TPA: FtsQ-type POTRA domain-containing protein [Candidatus Andersenbacteria bacterium]|nr:MAG: hypothetical protein A2854_01545 [Parcubacteria group bacterium RIFCSPHIGHO2_01_FULL_56_18]HLD26143.1 FtsQ-type POTRA domain-containing protein [Candidatus Andersenbacteria bacterium]
MRIRLTDWRWNWRRAAPRLVPWLSIGLLVTLVLGAVVLFAWLLFFTDIFTVQAVTVVDAREHTGEHAREIIDSKLQQMALSRNIFFVQTEVLEAALYDALPQVRTVHVQRKLPGTIKAVVQEKTPVVLLLSSGRYYFVDDSGIPYEEARLETLPGIVLPTIRNDDTQTPVTLGVVALAPEFVAFLQAIQAGLPTIAGSEVAQIRIPSLSSREVHVVLGNNWTIKFDVSRSAERQLTLLSQLLSSMVSETEKQQLEYIDLRVINRVYYRTRGA